MKDRRRRRRRIQGRRWRELLGFRGRSRSGRLSLQHRNPCRRERGGREAGEGLALGERLALWSGVLAAAPLGGAARRGGRKSCPCQHLHSWRQWPTRRGEKSVVVEVPGVGSRCAQRQWGRVKARRRRRQGRRVSPHDKFRAVAFCEPQSRAPLGCQGEHLWPATQRQLLPTTGTSCLALRALQQNQALSVRGDGLSRFEICLQAPKLLSKSGVIVGARRETL